MTKKDMMEQLESMKTKLTEVVNESAEESNAHTRRHIITKGVSEVQGEIRDLQHKISNL